MTVSKVEACLPIHISKRNQWIEDKELASSSFAVQKIYFDCQNAVSKLGLKTCSRRTVEILNNSLPDLQLVNLKKDLEHFLQIREKKLSVTEKNLVYQMLAKLGQAQHCALLIGSIISAPFEWQKRSLQMELKRLIKDKLDAMLSGESVLIPGGYMNGNVYDLKGMARGEVVGHSILLEVRKEKDRFQVQIYNTGEGVQLHEEDPVTGKFYPLCYENIPQQRMVNEIFIDALTQFALGSEKGCVSIYNLLTTWLGAPRKNDARKDKPYRDQGVVGSCTKKSLQVWLHDQFRIADPLYRQFRCFRLDQAIQKVESIQKEMSDALCYQHPLARWGFTNSVKFLIAVLQGLRGALFGSRVKFNIPYSEINRLLMQAKCVLKKRQKALLFARLS